MMKEIYLMKMVMRKIIKNTVIQEHIIPTLIVVGWFGLLLALAIMVTNA